MLISIFRKKIELKCKKCESKAVANNFNVPERIDHFMDISSFEKVWNVVCLNCTYRGKLNWAGLNPHYSHKTILVL